ncbi:MAG: ABC transporter permease [Terriglobia bacterium]|jgi:predicted permease
MPDMMRWIYKLPLRFRSLFRKSRVEKELSDELRFHLEKLTAEFAQQGMMPEEARYAALRELGGVEQIKEECRDMRRVNYIENLVQDVRFSLRQFAKNPGFTVVGILILSLGMCGSLAIFGFVDAALIKPLPYRNSTRLVGVTESDAMFPRAYLSYPDYLDWKKLNTVFSSMDVWGGTGFLLRTAEGVQPVTGVRVSSGFFRTLGITPMLGRDFYVGEDQAGAPKTVMLTYAGWQRWFGGKPEVVGRPVTLDGISCTIIGVLPRGFQFAPRGSANFWTPLQAAGTCDLRRSCHSLEGIARLKDGVSVETALAEMKTIAADLERQYPGSNRGQSASVVPLAEVIVGDIRPILLVLLGGAGLLLLIAYVNVAGLLVARSEGRKREIAVREALGASSWRLIRQFATEGLLLVAISGALGLLSAEWTIKLLTRLIPPDMMAGMPYLQGLGLNFHVWVFSAAISLVAAGLYSITPILRLSLSEMREGLAEGSRGSAGTMWRRVGSNLVAVELAIAMVLLSGAGLLGKSLYRLLHVDLGFQPDHLAMLEVAAPPVRYAKDPQVVELGRRVISRIAGLPGVGSVGIVTQGLPLSGNFNTDWIRFVGRPYNGEHNEVNERHVTSAYFTTLKAKLLRGRFFTDADDASKPHVVIINQALARKYFPNEDPIGKKYGDDGLSPGSIKEIVGVVDNVKEGALDSEIWPAEYIPFNQSPDTYFAVVVRTSQAEHSVLPTLDTVIHQIDPELGTMGEMTMTQRISDSQTAYLHRSSTWLIGGFAALALLLGVVGLYGVIAYSVSRRTREIGVRMALGAQRGTVYGLILKEAGWLISVGIAAGLLGSIVAATLMHKLLFGTQAYDVPTLAAVASLLAISALFASYIPARRATRVDPMVALRYE